MPSGAKKRKAAKKKKQQAANHITISTKSNHGNGDPRGQEEKESNDSINSLISHDNENDHHPFVIKDTIKIEKNLRPEETIKIIDSNTEQNKASSSSSSSSSDEESQEIDKRDVKEAGDYAILATGNATFSGPNANANIENTPQVQSTILVQPNSIEQIRTENTSEKDFSVISVVDTLISREDEENADKNAVTYDENTQPSLGGIKESEVTISSHEKEAPLRSPHGIERRTSWLSCCGLFDVITESRI